MSFVLGLICLAGRKTKYDTHVKPKLFLIEHWVKDGLTDKEIAKRLRVAYSTLRLYIKKYSELSATLKNSKEIVDYEVEGSLYKKCVGTYAKEERAFKCKEIYYDEEGRRCEKEVVKTVEVDVFIPPDTMAIAIWLNNRRPDKWRRNAGKERLDEKKFEHEKSIDEKKYW